MASLIYNITIDCTDPYRLAQFWAEVTGWTEDPENANHPDDPGALLVGPDTAWQLGLLFIAGPDIKTVKNRVHLDLRPTDRSRDEEVDRLLDLGARLIDDRRNPDGTGWVVLGDPEGNEFCIERSAVERSAVERSAAERRAAMP